MPRRHPLGRREVREQVVRLRPLQGDRPQALCAIHTEDGGEQPLAEATVRVVENHPALLGHGRRYARAGEVSSTRFRQSRSICLIIGGYTIRWRNGRIAAI